MSSSAAGEKDSISNDISADQYGAPAQTVKHSSSGDNLSKFQEEKKVTDSSYRANMGKDLYVTETDKVDCTYKHTQSNETKTDNAVNVNRIANSYDTKNREANNSLCGNKVNSDLNEVNSDLNEVNSDLNEVNSNLDECILKNGQNYCHNSMLNSPASNTKDEQDVTTNLIQKNNEKEEHKERSDTGVEKEGTVDYKSAEQIIKDKQMFEEIKTHRDKDHYNKANVDKSNTSNSINDSSEPSDVGTFEFISHSEVENIHINDDDLNGRSIRRKKESEHVETNAVDEKVNCDDVDTKAESEMIKTSTDNNAMAKRNVKLHNLNHSAELNSNHQNTAKEKTKQLKGTFIKGSDHKTSVLNSDEIKRINSENNNDTDIRIKSCESESPPSSDPISTNCDKYGPKISSFLTLSTNDNATGRRERNNRTVEHDANSETVKHDTNNAYNANDSTHKHDGNDSTHKHDGNDSTHKHDGNDNTVVTHDKSNKTANCDANDISFKHDVHNSNIGHEMSYCTVDRNTNDSILKHDLNDSRPTVKHNLDTNTAKQDQNDIVKQDTNDSTVEHDTSDSTVRHDANNSIVKHDLNDCTVKHNVKDIIVKHETHNSNAGNDMNCSTVKYDLKDSPAKHDASDSLVCRQDLSDNTVQHDTKNSTAMMQLPNYQAIHTATSISLSTLSNVNDLSAKLTNTIENDNVSVLTNDIKIDDAQRLKNGGANELQEEIVNSEKNGAVINVVCANTSSENTKPAKDFILLDTIIQSTSELQEAFKQQKNSGNSNPFSNTAEQFVHVRKASVTEQMEQPSEKIESCRKKSSIKNPLLECSSCYSFYKDPRTLPCQHTFCLECIQNKMAEHCILCSNSFLSMTPFQARDLPKNKAADAFIASLPPIEKCVMAQFGKHKLPCRAELLCIDCWESYCDECGRGHTLYSPHLKTHVIKSIREMSQSDIAKHNSQSQSGRQSSGESAVCKHYTSEEYNAFNIYKPDDSSICALSSVSTQAPNKITWLNKKEEEENKEFFVKTNESYLKLEEYENKYISKLSFITGRRNQVEQQCKTLQACLNDTISTVKVMIKESFAAVERQADAQGQKALRLIQEIADKEIQELASDEIKANKIIEDLREMKAICKTYLSICSVAADRASFISRLKESMKKYELNFGENSISLPDIAQWTSDIEKWASNVSDFISTLANQTLTLKNKASHESSNFVTSGSNNRKSTEKASQTETSAGVYEQGCRQNDNHSDFSMAKPSDNRRNLPSSHYDNDHRYGQLDDIGVGFGDENSGGAEAKLGNHFRREANENYNYITNVDINKKDNPVSEIHVAYAIAEKTGEIAGSFLSISPANSNITKTDWKENTVSAITSKITTNEWAYLVSNHKQEVERFLSSSGATVLNGLATNSEKIVMQADKVVDLTGLEIFVNRLNLKTIHFEFSDLHSTSALSVMKYLVEYDNKKVLMTIDESNALLGRTYCYLVGPRNKLDLAEHDLKKYGKAYKPFQVDDLFKYDEYATCVYECKMPGIPVLITEPNRLILQKLITAPHRITVTIKTGDLLKEQVEVIVNASNYHLELYGAVAKLIRNAAGPRLEKECQQRLNEIGGVVRTTENVVTDSYNLQTCKNIMHAVGPTKHDVLDDKVCIQKLSETFLNCLRKADQCQLASIALPAISSGAGGMTMEQVAESYCNAVLTYLSCASDKTVLTDIRLLLIDNQTTNQVRKYFTKHFFNLQKESLVACSFGGAQQPIAVYNYSGSQQPQQPIAVHDYGGRPSTDTGAGVVVHQPMSSLNDKCSCCGNKWSKLNLVQLSCGHYLCNTCKIAKLQCSVCLSNKLTQTPQTAAQGIKYQQPPGNQQTNKHISASPSSSQMSASLGEDCVICLDTIVNPMRLSCNHVFCKGCIEEHLKHQRKCPTCGKLFGIQKGNQPDGKMESKEIKTSLPGYPGCGAIVITYTIHNGIQQHNHPHPGKPFVGTTRTAYLPNNAEGKKILSLLRTAFDNRLIFTIGRSTTTGQEDVVTWNDIHHKTSPSGSAFSYPDPTYLKRVTEELAAKGIQ